MSSLLLDGHHPGEFISNPYYTNLNKLIALFSGSLETFSQVCLWQVGAEICRILIPENQGGLNRVVKGVATLQFMVATASSG